VTNTVNIKVGRNELCPCGSGKKYKKCCEGSKKPIPVNLENHYRKKYGIDLKKEKDIDGIREAGKLVVETHKLVEDFIRPGMSTDEINTFVHDYTIKHGAIPAPLNYKGYPKSVCVSVNDVICHGIPGDLIINEGDIVNIDITSILNGYYADSNQTLFIGTPGDDAKKIVQVARDCFRAGMSMVVPGNTIGDIGWAIQTHAEKSGCSVVREFIGHGIGIDFHEAPQVPHFGKRGSGVPLVPGMVFTVEPMINLGGNRLYILDDEWTAVTADGSLSAQFEETIVVTEDGYESLTPMDI